MAHQYPEGFRARRGINWSALGIMYATYYICRYSFKYASPGLAEEHGYSLTEISDLWGIWSLAYGTGQLVNGLVSDRLGGKKCMLIGAIGTVIVNLIMGFSSLLSIFSTFVMIFLVNGYFQSFGAPGMIKINAAWFKRTERGTFAGIFGAMIQLGKISLGFLAPWILSGMVIADQMMIEPGNWRLLFRFGPMFTAVAAIWMAIVVKQTPEEAGYDSNVIVDEVDDSEGVTVSVKDAFQTIFSNPFVWFYALAYASTGAVRHSSDQLSNLFFDQQLGIDMVAAIPLTIAIVFALEPVVAFLGSLISGIVSDKFFKGNRAPVAMVLYLIEALIIIISAVLLLKGLVQPGPTGVFLGCTIILLIAFTVNSTHSLVGAAAPMDIGGKKYAGFASGVIDSFQYYGSALALFITGRVLDATQETHGWLFWFVIMGVFAMFGASTMFRLARKQKRMNQLA